MTTLKIFSTMRIKTHELLIDATEYLVARFKQSRKIFTVASPFGQILFVIQNLSQLIFYYIEDAITELNINQASRQTSVAGIASANGYQPSRAISASAEISVKPKTTINEEIPNNIIIVPNYTLLTCKNNSLEYTIILPQDELKINTADKSKSIRIALKQGRIETQFTTGKNQEYQSFNMQFPKNFMIDNHHVYVYVNDVKWKRYDRLFDMPKGENTYYVRTGVTSGLDVFFGNRFFGSIPQAGAEIRVEYLVSDGFSGNINVSNPESIVFDFKESGFTIFGEEIDLNNVLDMTTTMTPYYGANPEPLSLTRQMISKSDTPLVSYQNYELLLKRLQSFSVIRIFPDPLDQRMLNLFLIPRVDLLLTGDENYFTLPEDKFLLTTVQKERLLQTIEMMGTKIVATDVKIIDPIFSRYVLNIAIIVFDDTPTDIIKNDIISVISEYFLNNSRIDRIPKSDLIKEVEGVDGVDSVSISIVSQKNENVKKINPNAADTGLDSFNDIIIDKNELPIVRGGWTDRYGNAYENSVTTDNLGCINILIKDITKRPQ